MEFQNALKKFKNGSKIRRKCWPSSWYVGFGSVDVLGIIDILAKDWEWL